MTVEQELLYELRQDDDQWLWEVVWTLNTSHPHAPLSAKVALAKAAVRNLLDHGLVTLWAADRWPPNSYTPLLGDEIERLFTADRPWHPTTAETLVELRAPTRRNRHVGSGSVATVAAATGSHVGCLAVSSSTCALVNLDHWLCR